VNRTCAICNQTGIIRQTAIFLGNEMTRFYGGGTNEIETGYLKIPMCAKCRGHLDSAGFLSRIWFVMSGFLAVLTALGIVMGASITGDGGGIDVELAVVVSLLGLGAAVSFVLYRRERERLRERLVRWLSNRSSEEDDPDSHSWIKKLVESKGGGVVVALLVLMLVVSLGSLIGVFMWEVIKGVAETAIASPKVIVAAIAGAAASMTGFVLFALVLSLFGPIQFVAFEQWTVYIAPVIGGTIGAAIGDGLAVSVIYIVVLSAMTGGITLLIHDVITAKKRITLKAIHELVIAGLGLGAINGIILAIFFKVLEATVGISWLLAG
jgi:hypothetical protein